MSVIIPHKLVVGYNCPAKALSYVTYRDNKGNISQPVAFDNWRDKEVPVDEFPNEMQSKLEIVNWSGGVENSWGFFARKTYVRVKEEHGVIFEIPVSNFLKVVKYSSKDSKSNILNVKYYLGWEDSQVEVICAECEDYRNSFTVRDNQPVKVSELVPETWYLRKDGTPIYFIKRVKPVRYRYVHRFPAVKRNFSRPCYQVGSSEFTKRMREFQDVLIPQKFQKFPELESFQEDKLIIYMWDPKEGVKEYKSLPPLYPCSSPVDHEVPEGVKMLGEEVEVELEHMKLEEFEEKLLNINFRGFYISPKNFDCYPVIFSGIPKLNLGFNFLISHGYCGAPLPGTDGVNVSYEPKTFKTLYTMFAPFKILVRKGEEVTEDSYYFVSSIFPSKNYE